jgi:ferrous iron transport protein B
VAPLMSCSARLPVYLLLIGAFLTRDFPAWLPGLTLFGLYLLGLVLAPLVALVLKRTLLRGETPVFVMEMPLYKTPSWHTVWRRMRDSGWTFVRRAGTLILASMILVWALLYFPHTAADGGSYDQAIAGLEERLDQAGEDQAAIEEQINRLERDWKSQSYLGRMGKALEPAVEPLGWDWRIGMAALASFPAREVFVGTMGIIYSQGKGDSRDEAYTSALEKVLRQTPWDHDPARKVYSVPVALSVMVFFALCCQCASTLAVIKRETNSWKWPALTFVYMTVLAYLGALVAYQLGNLVT